LPPEAKTKWNEATAEKDPRKKMHAFQEFLSMIPKHKSNEHLRAQIRTKIATLKDQVSSQRGRNASPSPWSIEREGAAQVIILGPTNVGRSSLLRALTKARPPVAEYEFTTQRPIPGMLNYEDIQFQLIELPAPLPNPHGGYDIHPDGAELLRTCDGLILIVDLSSDPQLQLCSMTRALEDIRISIRKPSSRVEIVHEKGSGEIRVATSGSQISADPEEIQQLLRSYGIKNVLIRLYGNVTISDVEDAVLENVTLFKPSLIIGNKLDHVFTRKGSVNFGQELGGELPVILTSCLTGQGLEAVGQGVFRCLGLVRVYTKEPNESRPSDHPIVVREGATIKDLARSIHSHLAERYRYSRIWGPTSRFAGERVGLEHVLGDRDIVEIHAE
jgi:ribosome-interacting GTPase 1